MVVAVGVLLDVIIVDVLELGIVGWLVSWERDAADSGNTGLIVIEF